MGIYKLSNDARGDLNSIYYYGVVELGLNQADEYYDGLLERFDRISEAPLMYQKIDHIREGYRRSVYGKHSIYYLLKTIIS